MASLIGPDDKHGSSSVDYVLGDGGHLVDGEDAFNLAEQALEQDEWTETFGTERLTGALLDRLTYHVNILEMNGESYRLSQSRHLITPCRTGPQGQCAMVHAGYLGSARAIALGVPPTGLLLRRHVAGFVSAVDTQDDLAWETVMFER